MIGFGASHRVATPRSPTGAKGILLVGLLLVGSEASAQSREALRTLPPNTALDLGLYDCTRFEALGGHAVPNCRTITDYGGMVYDEASDRMLVWGGGHAATYRDDVEAFDLDRWQWAPDAPPTPCEEMTLENVDLERSRWISSNRPISRHAYDLLVPVPPRRELWMLARMQGRGRGCHRLPPVDEEAGSPYVLGRGTFAAYSLDDKTWRFTDVPSESFQTGAEYDPVSGRILLVTRRALRWFDPASGTVETIRELDEPGIDTNDGVTLLYHAALDRFYVLMTRPRRDGGGGVWEIRLDRDDPASSQVEKLDVAVPDPPPEGRDAWAYDAVNELFVGGVSDEAVYAFDPRTRQWYRQEPAVVSEEGARIGRLLSKALAYDPVSGVIVFRARTGGPGSTGERTWAYRWGGDPPPLPPPSPDAGADGSAGADPDAGGPAGSGAGETGGCGCGLAARPADPIPGLLLGGLVVPLLARRRRRRRR